LFLWRIDSFVQLAQGLAGAPEVQYKLLAAVFALRPTLVDADSDDAPLPPTLHERFLYLMCEYEPTTVYAHLRATATYRVAECLAICQQHRITDATAWLMEQSGDIAGAFALIFEVLFLYFLCGAFCLNVCLTKHLFLVRHLNTGSLP
jgi:hypothetical protein